MISTSGLTRRSFLAFTLVPLALRSEDAKWRARIAPDSEPGERLVIAGRVLQADGRPAPGIVLRMYQTDAKGIYGDGQGHPRQIAKLRGALTSGPNGEFEIVTIKPGNYPGGGVPAHIHLLEPGSDTRELPEFVFAGDRYLKGNENAYVLKLERDGQGAWRARHDITLPR